MTPAEVAERHREIHVACATGCTLMGGKDVPAPVVPCGGLCQARRWQKLDRAEGHYSRWNPEPPPEQET